MKKKIFLLIFLLFIFSMGSYLFGVNQKQIIHNLNSIVMNIKNEIPEKVLSTVFIKLGVKEYPVPVKRSGNGGGLTSIERGILLLTHEGSFYLHNKDKDLIKLDIEAPENGFEEYKKISETAPYNKLQHNLDSFRYNDIQYYKNEKESGLVVSYTEFDLEHICYTNSLSKLIINDSSLNKIEFLTVTVDDWEVIYRSKPCLPFKNTYRAIEGHMAGGRITFESPSTIWLSSGDYHHDGIYSNLSIAQKKGYEYGKVINVNLESKSYEVYGKGLRNMQGIVIDKKNRIFTVEHGVRGGDELNLIKKENNYGWPLESLGTLYNRMPIPGALSYGSHETYDKPFYSWVPSVATSNLTLIENFHPAWDGDLLVSSLAGKSLFRLRLDNDRVLFVEPIKIGERIRYAHQHDDGNIVLWTDSKKLLYLTPQSNGLLNEFLDRYFKNSQTPENIQKSIKEVLNQCLECHEINPHSDLKAPKLTGVYNSDIASGNYSFYSDALKNKSGVWNKNNLKNYIYDPQMFAPGSNMPQVKINDPQVLDGLVNILEAFQGSSE